MSNRNRVTAYIRAAVAAVLFTLAANGQYMEYRAVRGRVKFRDGEPVRGAAVQLKNLRTLQIRSYLTKAGGTYHFDGLNSDVDYELRAQYHGRFGPAKTLSKFNSRKQAVIDLTIEDRALKPASVR